MRLKYGKEKNILPFI